MESLLGRLTNGIEVYPYLTVIVIVVCLILKHATESWTE